jgi:hypothetical protein
MSALNCFAELVGLETQGWPVPATGLYVNRLPGLSLKVLEASTDDAATATLSELWMQTQDAAWLKLQAEAARILSRRFSIRRHLGDSPTWANVPPKDTLAEGWLGVLVEVDSDALTYAELRFEEIHLLVNQAVNQVSFKCIDANSGTELWTTKVDLNAGENHIPLAKEAYVRAYPSRFYLLFDSSGISLKTRQLEPNRTFGLNVVPVSLASIDPLAHAVVLRKSALQVQIRLGCSEAAILCAHAPVFAETWMYLLGSELVTRIQHSPRLNRFTVLQPERLNELQVEYERQGIELLTSALNGLDLHACDACLQDQRPVRQGWALP